jgi:glucose-6-phosphate 1-dehydrogenase
MDCPKAYEAEAIRDEKVKVLKRVKPLTTEQVFKNVVRAQYTAGEIHGAKTGGLPAGGTGSARFPDRDFCGGETPYRQRALEGGALFLRTGKSMPRQSSVIMIQFKESPHKIFKDDIVPNKLIISIQPELGIGSPFSRARCRVCT